MHQGTGHIATGSGDGQHVVVLSALDHGHHRFGIGCHASRRGQPSAASGRQHRQRGTHRGHPLVGRRQGHEVGFEEVAVVVGIFFRAQRVRAPVVLVPVASFLADLLTGSDEVDLAARLVFDGPAE